MQPLNPRLLKKVISLCPALRIGGISDDVSVHLSVLVLEQVAISIQS